MFPKLYVLAPSVDDKNQIEMVFTVLIWRRNFVSRQALHLEGFYYTLCAC